MSAGKTYGIKEYVEFVNGALWAAQGRGVWVEGEIRGLNVVRGNTYLDLVEVDGRDSYVLNAALWMWKKQELTSRLDGVGFELRVGIRVRLFGKADVHPANGRFTFKIDDIDVAFTLGDLARRRAELVEHLKKSGLYDANRALPEPEVPMRLAIVTSVGSAAHADVLSELRRRGFGFDVTVLNSLVQGPEAPRALARALANASALDVDVVLLVRGGGSKGDLDAFDTEEVAIAIARCRHPVFTGIGHEIDTSVADEVAYRRFKTPTACAGDVGERVQRFLDDLEDTWLSVSESAGAALVSAEQDVSGLASSIRDRVVAALAGAEADLRGHRVRLGSRPREIVRSAHSRVDLSAARLRLLDPVNTLRRGWSIVRDESGRVIRSVSDVAVGDVMVARFADGTATGRIEEIREDGGD